MTGQLIAQVRAATTRSELLAAVASVRVDGGQRLALGDNAVRPLVEAEVHQLERQGNVAEDWSRVRVAEGFSAGAIRNSEFRGDVILGSFSGSVPVGDGQHLSSGICNCTIANSVVGHGTLVRDVRLLANYVIAPGAVVLDCGRVTCEAGTTFGNGTRIPVGIETGGREVSAFAELGIELAAVVAQPAGHADLKAKYAAAVGAYRDAAVSPRGIIESRAQVLSSAVVRNAYIGACGRVDGVTLLEDSTLLSSEEEPTQCDSGAIVRGSLLQWGSHVSTLAIVDRSLLTEHSLVERHAKVIDSILGPNTVVGGGEVTSCLLGPFVAAHHQSLLIATLWPKGRGNVGYGANVGSNHTSRAPDQECCAGEGMFFGLGVNIKFPADFSRAPYSVVACGVNLLPQRIAFPFSLISAPAAAISGVPPAYAEIVPGWMLSDNLFALRRNEGKFRSRNKARRSRFDFEVLRPGIIDLIADALHRLEAVRPVKDVYTEADVDGLGKCYLLDRHRRRAIETYRFILRYYALMGLKNRAEETLAAGDNSLCRHLLEIPSELPRWEHQRRLLIDALRVTDVAVALQELPELLERYGCEVEESRTRDDRRGLRIIDDYADSHVAAADDPWVQASWKETRRLQAEVAELLQRWAAMVVNGKASARVQRQVQFSTVPAR